MWLIFAFGSALFAGLTAILAKCGIRRTDSTMATAICTVIVLAFSWIMAAMTGAWPASRIGGRTLLFLALSGMSTGASWLCYFKALQTGDINKVVPINKLSILVTVGFSYAAFHEKLTKRSGTGLVLIVTGTLAMLL